MTESIEQVEAIPPAFMPLMRPARYKVYYGGRGGGKSWAFAKALVIKSYGEKLRILCGREFQNSIADSVHRLISDQIDKLGLKPWFNITQTTITSKTTGSQFIFKGLQRSIQEIKSTEGIDIAWIEEAQNTSEQSWKVLIPTIRKENSEIWVSYNPENEDDPTHKRFVLNPPPDSVVKKTNWSENPHFPEVLNKERLYMLSVDPEAYMNVWEGECRQISDEQIFINDFWHGAASTNRLLDISTIANGSVLIFKSYVFSKLPELSRSCTSTPTFVICMKRNPFFSAIINPLRSSISLYIFLSKTETSSPLT